MPVDPPHVLPPPPAIAADATWRRCQRMLRTVAELHKRGYQHLRVMPHLHDIGTWRLGLGPRGWFSARFGLTIDDRYLPDAPQYTSADQNHPFGWQDAGSDDARALAQKLIERFPNLLIQCEGRDWTYAGWYAELLGWVEAGHLPFANPKEADMWTPADPLKLQWTPLITVDLKHQTGESRCPLPPPGLTSA